MIGRKLYRPEELAILSGTRKIMNTAYGKVWRKMFFTPLATRYSVCLTTKETVMKDKQKETVMKDKQKETVMKDKQKETVMKDKQKETKEGRAMTINSWELWGRQQIGTSRGFLECSG
jgi:isocitrate dehydrogenase